MSTLAFDYLKITTMTIVMQLEGHINLNQIFPLLEITRLDLPPTKRKTKRRKIPFCPTKGAILSARYDGLTRGIIRAGSFLNSITIDIATSVKNVSIKLSKNKIQMCGATSVALANEASDLIIGHLHRTQKYIDTMNEDKDLTSRMVEWIVEKTKGQVTLVDNLIRRCINIPTEYPEEFNSEIVKFILGQAQEYLYHEDYIKQVRWVSSLQEVINGPIKVTDLTKVMVNFNYDLGFHINRWYLAQHINGRNGFISRYDNSVDHSVTIELPYKVPSGNTIIRRKNKIPCHTFLVYKSGLVTQSGPNEDIMRGAYNLFNQTINDIRGDIEKVGIPRKLRFTAVFPKAIEKQVSETPTEDKMIDDVNRDKAFDVEVYEGPMAYDDFGRVDISRGGFHERLVDIDSATLTTVTNVA